MKLLVERFFPLLLVLVMIVSVVGCSKSEEKKDTSSIPDTSQSDAEAARKAPPRRTKPTNLNLMIILMMILWMNGSMSLKPKT